VDCNQALCRMVERDKAELVGQPQSILHPPEDLTEGMSPAFRQHRAGDAGRAPEERLLSRSGQSIQVEIRATRIPMNGRDYLLGVFRDITERRQLEERFLRAQRLESIGALASGIAHDLNNVLMPLGMGVALLRQRRLAAEDGETLKVMEQSVWRGAAIIKQILTFARGMKGERAQVQLRHLGQDMLGVIYATFPKTITTTSELPQELWPVTGDATQLGQVLMNLCVNARDAMPKGGALTLRAENRVVDEQFAGMNPGARPGPHVLLSVKDTGSGIPPEVLPKIFDPFFTTKEIGKGTGLGLATAQGIVKDHGGFITVRTQVGRGTEFQVYLPADAAEETPPRVSPAPALPQGRGELVLVVDDEVAIAQIMKATLEHNGYRVLLAEDGANAVAVFAEHKTEIRAVVMDVGMPVMDGAVTACALRHIAPAVPILLMTGSPARASELGRDAIVSLLKPFSKEGLLTKLRQVLEENAECGSEAGRKVGTRKAEVKPEEKSERGTRKAPGFVGSRGEP